MKNLRNHTIIIYLSLVAIVIAALLLISVFFYNRHLHSDTIQSSVYIKGNNVSGLTKEQATTIIEDALKSQMNDNVILKYKNVDYYVEVEQIEAKFDIESSIDFALNIGKKNDFFTNIKDYIRVTLLGIDIDPVLDYNEQALDKYIDMIQTQLPDQLEQSSYYVEDGELIITNGKLGAEIRKDELKEEIIAKIQDISYSNQYIDIPTNPQYPDPINLDAIHADIYREMQNAYFSKDPYMVYPEVVGVDFSVAEATEKLSSNPHEEEYHIELDYTKPQVTVNDIGYEAFPNLLASFSTKYVNNANRTTNLRLAAGKINGTVVMPGETFSYNKVVGKRTVAAGYKDAAIYENGQVTDGLGGGICQISTTLYNAAVEADMTITDRRNHMFVPTYVSAGYDATVVWGSQDFKFQNTRNYPIKIETSVANGVAQINIYGLLTDDEYDISIETKTIKSTSTSLVVDSYKVYRRNGQIVNQEKLDRDTYKKH